jgi:uncharacterized protein (DUF58 family)
MSGFRRKTGTARGVEAKTVEAKTVEAKTVEAKTVEAMAHGLAKRLPALLVEASRVAHTVAHGVHGRRRAGSGETFWQFRHFEGSDAAALIDWRRSASSDHLFVREREWEAAHTVWLWPDVSASMEFCSHLSSQSKRDRALVLTFALAELLIDGGERVGLLGALPPSSSRSAVEKMALALLRDARAGEAPPSLPPHATLRRFSECVLVSDFLEPFDALKASIERLASQGAYGHLIHVLDPAEETLPYEGRIEFSASEGEDEVLAERAEDLRREFARRMEARRKDMATLARRLRWSYLTHHTSRPASEALLAMHGVLSGATRRFPAGGFGGRRGKANNGPTDGAGDAGLGGGDS